MRVKIIINERKEWAHKIKEQVIEFLKKKGVEIVEENADKTLVIGGDGSILFFKNRLEGPVIGIGSETSYLCQLRNHNWKENLLKYVNGKEVEKRIMLSCHVGGKYFGDAINDVAVLGVVHRVIPIEYEIDGRKKEFEGDGLIISTPTGSTSYAYSAGGEEIPAKEDKIEVVPLAPYRRKVGPETFDGLIEVKVTVKDKADVVLDGQLTLSVKKETEINILKSKKEFLYALPE